MICLGCVIQLCLLLLLPLLGSRLAQIYGHHHLLGVGLGLAAYLVINAVYILLHTIAERFELRGYASRMRHPGNYVPVGQNLARYCQTVPSLMPSGDVGDTWLPISLTQFNPTSAEISPDGARVELLRYGSRLGYALERDAGASGPTSNAWVLTFYWGTVTEPLLSFRTDPADDVPMSEYVANTVAEYDRQMVAGSWYRRQCMGQRKVRFLLQFGTPESARGALRDLVSMLPDYGWPRVLMALADVKSGRPEEAERRLRHWGDAYPGYDSYVHLAYFYQLLNRPGDAAVMVEKALGFPVTEGDDYHSSPLFRGYEVARHLYESGRYATAIKLCEALEPHCGMGPTPRAIRAAAIAAQAGDRPVSIAPRGMPPYADINLDRLVGDNLLSC